MLLLGIVVGIRYRFETRGLWWFCGNFVTVVYRYFSGQVCGHLFTDRYYVMCHLLKLMILKYRKLSSFHSRESLSMCSHQECLQICLPICPSRVWYTEISFDLPLLNSVWNPCICKWLLYPLNNMLMYNYHQWWNFGLGCQRKYFDFQWLAVNDNVSLFSL